MIPSCSKLFWFEGHAGDSVLPIAYATHGGKTVTFEVGPPYDVLEINIEINPQLDIDAYHIGKTCGLFDHGMD